MKAFLPSRTHGSIKKIPEEIKLWVQYAKPGRKAWRKQIRALSDFSKEMNRSGIAKKLNQFYPFIRT